VLVQHARRLVEQRLVEQAIARISKELTEQAATVDLSGDLRERIDVFLEENPRCPGTRRSLGSFRVRTTRAWENIPRTSETSVTPPARLSRFITSSGMPAARATARQSF
jgi:hypothetical protein